MALAEALGHDYDLLIVDLGLPKLPGIEVIRTARAAGLDVAILVITASSSAESCVTGLDAGADDYLVKPFRMTELMARTRALLRRRVLAQSPRVTVGGLAYDRVRRTFYESDEPLLLSRRESDILEVLVQSAGDLVLKEVLASRMSHLDQEVTPNLIEVYVHRLRKRLLTMDVEIKTVRGLGYVLCAMEAV